MGRKRTGTFQRSADGTLRLRIPITARQGGETKTVRIWASADPSLSDAEAKQLAEQMTQHFAGRVVDPQEVYRALRGEQATTIRDFVTRVYLPTREGQKTHKRQVQWWNLHILPTLQNADVRTFDGEILRELVRRLDEKVSDENTRFDWKTALNVWGLVTKFCADLAESKDPKIRIRKSNPAAGVRGPDRGDRAVKQWLYPSELQKLLDCDRVPVSRRRRWALLVYFFARAGEVHGLDWDRIDLEHGVVTIDRARDLRSGTVGKTKTHDVRVFPIEPILLPMLRAMKAEGAGFTGSDDGAIELRRDLEVAGVTREELFRRRSPNVPITQHDLRATGITYLAMRGESDDGIRERAGHTDFKMTQVYIRRGRRLAGATLGDPFAPLPESLLDGSAKQRRARVSSSNSSNGKDETRETSEDSTGSEVRRRGLEPLEHAPNDAISGTYAGSVSPKSPETRVSGDRIDDFEDENSGPLVGANRARIRRLEALAALSPEARPGLAVCRALEAAYACDQSEVERRLGEALDALGGDPEPVADARMGGAR